MYLGNYTLKQRQRRDVSMFTRFIGGTQGVPFQMPANGNIGVMSVAGSPAGIACTVNGDARYAPALPAGSVYRIGFVERARTVTVSAGYELVLDTGLGVWKPIGEIA